MTIADIFEFIFCCCRKSKNKNDLDELVQSVIRQKKINKGQKIDEPDYILD